MQDFDDWGFKYTEGVNVEPTVEKTLSKLKINNSLDLTKQLIELLKDNNYCRKIISSTTNRSFRKKITKKKITMVKDNKSMTRKQTTSLGVIADSKED